MLLILFALLPMHLAEILNGMEMTLFSFLMAIFVWKFESRSQWAWVIVPLLLLTRFESVFYLGFAVAGCCAVGGTERGYSLKTLFMIAGAFLLIAAGRWAYFSDFMPNTVWAKMHPPYTATSAAAVKIRSHLWATYLFVRSNAGFLAVGVLLAGVAGAHKLLGDIKVWLIVAFVCFTLATGVSKGYPQRLYVAVLPVFLLLAVQQCSDVRWHKLRIGWLQFTTFRPRVLVPAVAVLLGLFTNIELIKANASRAATGAFYQGHLSGPVLWRFGFLFPEEHFGVTPATYRQTGLLFDRLRILLGLRTLRVMSPDVGGLGLCCDGNSLNVLDSALLTNPILGRTGYAEFSAYFNEYLPDVIETHGTWSKVSKIYELSVFRSLYKPAVFDGTLLWIRNDRVDALRDEPRVGMTTVRSISDVKGVRYFSDKIRDHEVDREHFVTVDEVLVVRTQ